jgi:hypothetical protein
MTDEAKFNADMVPVKDSSAIAAHGYDTESRKLRLTFKSGTTHEYDDVPAEKYAAMTGSGSLGSFFHRRIKDVHASRKV